MVSNIRKIQGELGSMSLAGHVTFSKGELWLLLWGFASVIAFTSLDGLADESLPEPAQVVARLAIITTLVVVNRFMVMRAYRRELRKNMRMVPAIRLLNGRERQVLGLMARGLTPHEISVLLFISPGVVEGAIRSVMGKLDLKHRSQLVQWIADADDWNE